MSIPTGRPPPAPVIIAAAHPEPGPGHGTDSTVSTPSWARGREGELEGGGVPTLRRPSPPAPLCFTLPAHDGAPTTKISS